MSPVRMSHMENVVRVMLAFKDTFNRHDVPAIMKLISPDCEYENAEAPNDQKFKGKDEIGQYWRNYFNG